MSLLQATNLTKSFGHFDLFVGVTLSIPHGGRAAIVGPNGIGKTTLLRILVGLDEASQGQVQIARGARIAYLPQEAGLDSTRRLWDECLEALADVRAMEADLRRLEQAMSDPAQADSALERYAQLQPVFEHQGGYTYETRIRQVLTGLGFDESDYRRPLPQLSGGQRTRALLAKLLLSNPDLLVLDEPTNHLDIQAVEWLENYMNVWQGAALIVSHDRYFLDKVVNHIWEMRQGGIELYRGNYTAYVGQRQERWELRQQIFESERERLLKDMDYVKRNISGQNTLQAKGRLKRLSREIEAIESLGFEAVKGRNWGEIAGEADVSTHTMNAAEVERRIKALRSPEHRPPRLNLHLKAANRSGELVVRTRDLAIGYADEGHPLFNAPDLVLKRGECAALIGPNGAGKTTFLKTLLEKLPPYSGEVIMGASLDIAYFAQAHEELHPERTLVEEIDSVAPHMLLAEIREYLARYLFTGEDVFKKVSLLSGGERGRLALAKLALSNANLLLLDEPTNHLDIPSQEILQEVLDEYRGTILLVSHDRYLIDALATQVWEILPGAQELRIFAGTYSQYKAQLDVEKLAQEARSVESKRESAPRPAQPSSAEKRKNKRLKEIESEIHVKEAQLADLGRQLENPPADPTKVNRLGKHYVRVQDELDQLFLEWDELSSS